MEVINRKVTQDGNNFVITEQVKSVYTPTQILDRLQNIRHEKQYLKEQSIKLKEQFDKLSDEERELQVLIDEVEDDKIAELI